MKYQNVTYTIIFMVASLMLLMSTMVFSQEVTINKEVVAQSPRLLEKFLAKAISEKNFQDFGFRDFKEVQAARLGDPYPVKFIGLKELKANKGGTGARTLMSDSKQLWFPVMVGGEVRSQFVVREKGGKLMASQFGKDKTAQTISLVQKQMPAVLETKNIKAPYKTSLLEVPALMATFFYVESPQGDFLVPAMAQPGRYKLENGQLYPADEVLSKLREYAKEIDENLSR